LGLRWLITIGITIMLAVCAVLLIASAQRNLRVGERPVSRENDPTEQQQHSSGPPAETRANPPGADSPHSRSVVSELRALREEVTRLRELVEDAVGEATPSRDRPAGTPSPLDTPAPSGRFPEAEWNRARREAELSEVATTVARYRRFLIRELAHQSQTLEQVRGWDRSPEEIERWERKVERVRETLWTLDAVRSLEEFARWLHEHGGWIRPPENR